MNSTLTSKGQITIPARVRRQLGLHAGDKLAFFVRDNRIEVIPVARSVRDLKDLLPRPSKALSLEDLDKAIVDGASS